MSTGEWVQVSVAAVLAATLLAVLWYGWQARRQAEASVKMAEEMREQRLSQDRPKLLAELGQLDALEWEVGEAGVDETPAVAAHPKSMTYCVQNFGEGPAKEVVTTLLHPRASFSVEKAALLSPHESWCVRVTATKAETALREAIRGSKAPGMKEWMRSEGLSSRYYDGLYDCGLVVWYTDIQDRRWATYVNFGLIYRTDEVRKVIESRTLVPLEHRIVQLEGSG
jgi:hypothetical protein